MDLTINNEISKNTQNNNEIEDFMKQLQNTLTKDNSRINNFYNEILQEIPLASKFEHQLSDIIKECLDMMYSFRLEQMNMVRKLKKKLQQLENSHRNLLMMLQVLLKIYGI